MMSVWCQVSTESFRRPSTFWPFLESRFPVGSSARISAGRMMSALAMAARCCPPPESCSGKASSRSERPRVCVISRKKAISGVLPDRLKGKRMFSRTVSVGTRLKFW